jgi:signal transduction histidine kinase
MRYSKLFFHPIFVFIFSIVALATSLTLYIYWYFEVSAGLESVIRKFNLDATQFLEFQTWVVVLILSILVGIILLGIFIIFVYNQKTYQLYRLQHNFINNFTHELKTPVTSLKLFLETLSKHTLSREEQLKYIRYMLNDIHRLSDTINQILNLARIESKSFSGEFVLTDVVSTVEQFYQHNNHLFQNCEVTIRHPSDHSFFHIIDRPLFEMLLMNLTTNAIKYNTSPVPSLEISFAWHKSKLQIRFADNGIGLNKSEIKKVFKKFYQIGQSDDRSAMGSGLGLHLVQNIARLHKGNVFAESNGKEQGTVFTLILPQPEQAPPETRTAQ